MGCSGSWGLVSLTEPDSELPHSPCVTSLVLCVPELGEVLRAQKYVNFPPVGTVQTGMFGQLTWMVPEGIPRQCCPSLLLSAMPEAARLRAKGASSPSKSGEAAWVLSCPAWSSVLSEGAGNPQVAESNWPVADQDLSMWCLIPKPAGAPGYQGVVHVQVLFETPTLVRGLKAEESKTDPNKGLCPWAGTGGLAAAQCSRVPAAEHTSPWSYTMGISACLCFFPIAFCSDLTAASFPSSSSPSHLLHPSLREASTSCGTQGMELAAMAGWDVSEHCWDLSPLPSGLASKQRLKTRKQNKSVRKPGICVVSLKAECHSR